MFYIEEISMEKAKGLLQDCGLSVPEGVEYTAGAFDDATGALVATGSLKGDMLQGIAVDPMRQGEDLMGKLFTHLIEAAHVRGHSNLYLFTKPEKAVQFQGLGFKLVASARPYAALLEWGREGIEEYKKKLKQIREEAEESICHGKTPEQVGTIVMNCNPFTAGHRYLVETAASQVDLLYVIVVEEDKSLFSYHDRLNMAKLAVKDLQNVVVLGGDRYAVSSLTFPSYFTGEEKVAYAHTAVDAELFARHIGPALGTTIRFVGTEPLSPVTSIYNDALQSRLPRAEIDVVVVERKCCGEDVVSASKVRSLLQELYLDGKLDTDHYEGTDGLKLRQLLPESSYEYIGREEILTKLDHSFREGKKS